jgi:Protein of unknown function (DUF3568)
MQAMIRRGARYALLSVAALTSGCILAAAGAGAGGAVYVTDRGVESVVTAPVDRTSEAAKQAFGVLNITESRTVTEQEGGAEKRTLQGTNADREVSVNLKSEGTGTHVEVVVKKSAVTWDKDFAREVLRKIVELAK